MRLGLAAQRGMGLGLGAGQASGAVASNGLLNNLIAYWPLNEEGGANNALDLHSNGLTLTQVSSPGAATGKVYATARTFDGSADYFARTTDDALLSGGDVDLTLTLWVNFADVKSVTKWLARKRTASTIGGYQIIYSGADIGGFDRLRFSVFNNGSNGVNADEIGKPLINTWYFVVAWHDASNDTISIQVNNGGVSSAAVATGIGDDDSFFTVGQFNNAFWHNGRLGPVAMWKSAPGGGGVLDATKRAALWNGGAGLAYADFTT